MYPMIPVVATVVVIVGGSIILKDKGFMRKIKRKIHRFSGNDSGGDMQHSQDISDLTEQDGADVIGDLQNRLKESENRAMQQEETLKMLRSENLKLSTNLEVTCRKLDEAKRLSFDYFFDLLKWLQKILGKSKRGESDDNIDIEELSSILSKYGLTVCEDYKHFPEGFICIKDEKVTESEISLPMLLRGDDIELKGIVKVPMSFAGAQPPVDSKKSDLYKKTIASNENKQESLLSELKKSMSMNGDSIKILNEDYTSVSDRQISNHIDEVERNAESVVLENVEVKFENEDDFIILTKGGENL